MRWHPPAVLSAPPTIWRNFSRSVLSAASRREMTRRHWRNPHSSIERYYGLGIMSGNTEGWEWFGHGGGLQGYIPFTSVVPERELTVCILTNASDGWAGFWAEGALHILGDSRRGARHRTKCATGPGGGGTSGALPIWFQLAMSCWSPIRGSSSRWSMPPK